MRRAVLPLTRLWNESWSTPLPPCKKLSLRARVDRVIAGAIFERPGADVSDQPHEAVLTATVCHIIGGGAEKPARHSLPPPTYIASLAVVPESVPQVVAPQISIGLVFCFAVTPKDGNNAHRVPLPKPIADPLSPIALNDNS